MSNGTYTLSPASSRSHLARWIHRVLGERRVGVKFRLQGNHLYILCEGTPCPDQQRALVRLLPALSKVDINTLLPDGEPDLYQIFLYGRDAGHAHPRWQTAISLQQLDQHLEELYGQRSPQAASSSTALVISNQSLAKQGRVEAIAAYLSETLSQLGVSVQVRSRPLPYENPAAAVIEDGISRPVISQRLWITCEASYSPEPSLIAEPVTRQLRELELDGFRDAVVLIQVRGESRPDWVLRVDLTPAQELLREWARWGDVDALTRLLNQALAELRVGIATTLLKQSTLHLTCCWLPAAARQPDLVNTAPPLDRIRQVISAVIDRLGPQGIHQAVLYGQIPSQTDPAWVEWLSLPASQHQALAEPPLILARRGDWDAIAFLLSRRLNPNLDRQLATAGIRLKLLPKNDLLHVMCDAAVCPDQQPVGRAIAKMMKSLRIPHLAGVRVYGRRAGQKRPQWSYGVDFVRRQRFVPEASPEFAATDALVGDLLMRSDEAVLRPELTPEVFKTQWDQRWRSLLQGVRAGLVRSQIFCPSDDTDAVTLSEAAPAGGQSPRSIALIWGAVGLLLLLQVDWLLSRWIYAAPAPSSSDLAYLEDHSSLLGTSPLTSILAAEPETPPADAGAAIAPDPATLDLPDDWTAADVDDNAFDGGAFTQPDETVVIGEPPAAPPRPEEPASLSPADATAPGDAAAPLPPSPDVELADPELSLGIPSFNNPQLDHKLALYFQHLERYGPPDVLIVGSSRALRGVDPTVLSQELASLDHGDVTVFNFGVNGATAQVVDLVVRRLLAAEHLPRMIIWADGARAFNSGRSDRTYSSIAESEAYRQLNAGTLDLPIVDTNRIVTQPAGRGRTSTLAASLQDSYQAIDRWLSDRLAARSTVYDARDQVKYLVQRQFAAWLPRPDPSPQPVLFTLPGDPDALDGDDPGAIASASLVDVRGFLPLAVEFNPATYYQTYARVTGAHDRDYEAFRLEGQQAVATEALIDLTQTHNISLIFVNMPLTDEYLDPVRMAYEEDFRQHLFALSTTHSHFLFRDLGTAWPDQYRYFSDPSHLNRVGAIAVSQRLAQDAMIPWNLTQE
jgi:hypothetical protein